MIYDKTREETFYFYTLDVKFSAFFKRWYLLLTATGNWKHSLVSSQRTCALMNIHKILWFHIKSGQTDIGFILTFTVVSNFMKKKNKQFWRKSEGHFAMTSIRRSDYFCVQNINVILISITVSKTTQPSEWFKFTEWIHFVAQVTESCKAWSSDIAVFNPW